MPVRANFPSESGGVAPPQASLSARCGVARDPAVRVNQLDYGARVGAEQGERRHEQPERPRERAAPVRRDAFGILLAETSEAGARLFHARLRDEVAQSFSASRRPMLSAGIA